MIYSSKITISIMFFLLCIHSFYPEESSSPALFFVLCAADSWQTRTPNKKSCRFSQVLHLRRAILLRYRYRQRRKHQSCYCHCPYAFTWAKAQGKQPLKYGRGRKIKRVYDNYSCQLCEAAGLVLLYISSRREQFPCSFFVSFSLIFKHGAKLPKTPESPWLQPWGVRQISDHTKITIFEERIIEKT